MTVVKSLSFLFLVSTVFTTHALIYKDCGSVSGKIRSVAVSGCENSNICILKSGQNANLTVVFTSLEDTDKTKASVHGIIGGVPLPFPLPQTDACQNSGLDCPLSNGKNYTYTATIPISTAYPKIKVLVKWELQEAHGKDLFCVEIPSAIL
ncbi:NPC intracellular cholesterol transporter 2 homolog a [Daphnia magna]|uniref:NPC intracellular cholesterol transporter 2 homolog a n=1 Tax=Daphnia magna TaxID=35525 RepID=UPI0014027083|nr:NPC intracellular cholesterol transporter 2 homolog a [Daphnia magna]XP_032798055.1 NPC intracellular cholesterol transporter 2 homolog a [Daphnia magna]XP_045026289.1 NPC intracellular cholesterol transporter 2 homolog a [Daphnia magna]